VEQNKDNKKRKKKKKKKNEKGRREFFFGGGAWELCVVRDRDRNLIAGIPHSLYRFSDTYMLPEPVGSRF